jgi:hypothetical protein
MLLKAMLVISAAAAMAADDPWTKVQELKSGQELRVIKKGSPQPVMAQFGELTDENLVVIVKDTQKAIARDDIERIDARPVKKGSRVKTESRVETAPPGTGDTPQERNTSRPSQSTSSNISFEGKPGFETVYRRPR